MSGTDRYPLAWAQARIGEELGASSWLAIDQAMIDAHAETTGDAHWIHSDPARAAREAPFGGTIAQGSLLLSLMFRFAREVAPIEGKDGAEAFGLNYGFDRVRFVRPVLAGARARARLHLRELREKGPGRHLLVLDVTIEVDDADERPAVVAEWLGLVHEL